MTCPQCKTELTEEFAFCPKCGASLPKTEETSQERVSPESSSVISSPSQEDSLTHEAEVVDHAPESKTASAPVAAATVAAVSTSVEPVVSTVIPPVPSGATYASVNPPVQETIPKALKPLSTAGVFWYFFLSTIPVIGLITLLSVGFGSKNKSRRSLSRAILLWHILFLLAICIGFIILYFMNKDWLFKIFEPNTWQQFWSCIQSNLL